MPDIEDELDLDERSAVDFVAGLRRGWASTIYPAMIAEAGRTGGASGSLAQATETLRGLALYPWFSHLERQQQKMMWRVMGDAVLRRRGSLDQRLRVDGSAGGTLELDAGLELPRWYTDTDIHIQPGSFFADESSAFIYELGARVVMLRDNDGYKFHKLFAETALPALPGATRVVDVGCGFGKSTQVLVSRYPGAEVVGVDLSAPNLRLAHRQAEGHGHRIRWRQAASYDTGLASASADVVTGTMVLHEMPREAIEATLREAARLLRPGGVIRFLEFWPTGDQLRDATVYEHAERNNEPYFRDLFATDAPATLAAAGVPGARWIPFDERARGLTPEGRDPRPEWHFPWAVLAAEKPAAPSEEATRGE
ncbi:class I SAM-dependent methyltransferase [Micromonospora sp. NPDC047074]|uniref:class I SAM-dependent methyltransferase n=1 Tax=Micromonospora sp. NPDC047074 TaxID=3154339 RepID=UPI0033CE6A84